MYLKNLRVFACLFACQVITGYCAEYVGSSACQGCHQEAYQLWQTSDHYRSMQLPDAESVLGNFADVSVEFHGVTSRLFKADDGFFIETQVVGDHGKEESATFEIGYTFGHRPLQQYLVELTAGRVQALNIAWDSRSVDAGGQRWFHLRSELPEDSPFTWTRHFQNWNGRCAVCHSTNVSTGYDVERNSYKTTFSEINVGCEACHGPADDHIRTASAGETPSPLGSAAQTLTWHYGEDDAIASPAGTPNDAYIDMCGGCHSRRAVISELSPSKKYSEQYQLALLDAGLYHADGQILDEVFVLGSFLQSKMHRKGVTCMNCHEPHSGEVLFDDNRLCAQCHNPADYDVRGHLLHASGTNGSMCVDCHMPPTTYMSVDDRRDHRFGIPDPVLSESTGIPNACNDCHKDKSLSWAQENIPGEIPVDGFAMLNTRLQSLDPLAIVGAIEFIQNAEHAEIERATLLANLPLTDVSILFATSHLQNENEMIRIAAVRILNEAPLIVRQLTFPAVASDTSSIVRREAGRGLAELIATLSTEEAEPLLSLVNDFRSSFEQSLDMPSTQAELALLDQQLGDKQGAIAGFERAIAIEPHYVPGLLNLADLHRADGKDSEAIVLLEKAVAVAPDSGAANHSYALALVRQGDMEAALKYLKAATEQIDRQTRYCYVYAVALDSAARTSEAVQVLHAASKTWPNQYDLLMLEVVYREKAGLLSGIKAPLRSLARIAADEPQVQQRLLRYQVY